MSDDAFIELLCFPADTPDGWAYRCAEDVRQAVRNGLEPLPTTLLWLGASPRRWKLVTDALEGKKSKFNPSPLRLNIVRAHHNAMLRAARTPSGGINIEALKRGPTFFEVKCEFVRLFVPKKEWPKDWSRKSLREFEHGLLPKRQIITKTLERLRKPLRPDKVRRPRNSHPKAPR